MEITAKQLSYTCPGEEHLISRSVHLSRLAAFYPGCRDCKHRTDTGQLPQQTVARLQSTERRVERPSLFTDEGVRGVYLNELTRSRAGQIAAALASLLWEDVPLRGRRDATQDAKRVVGRIGPTAVVGYDERPSSPAIMTGVVSSLRRMGCHVVDIGVTTKPCFCFSVDHLQSSAGVYVTGSGCEPSWTGLDFAHRGAQPYSRDVGLDRLESRYLQGFSRPTRRAGTHRTFQANVPYEAGLWKHFHALRPLKLHCACTVRAMRDTLSRLFEQLPCELHFVETPYRRRHVNDPEDPDVVRTGSAVRDGGGHLGILIDDDCCHCCVLDESGRLIPSKAVTRSIAEMLLDQERGAAVVLETPAVADIGPAVEAVAGCCVDGGTSLAEISQAIRQNEAVFGGGESGLFWFREAFPACDAILTLAKVLQLLSRDDAPISNVIV